MKRKPIFILKVVLLLLTFCAFFLVNCSDDTTLEEFNEIVSDEDEVEESTDGENDQSGEGDTNGDETGQDGSDEGEVDAVFGLSATREPWENFDLSDWVIDTPAFDTDRLSLRHGELDWDQLINSDSRPFFFTHTDGGMRFVSTVGGAKTSENTKFSRSELREMLRAGNRNISTTGDSGNNWALGYQPENANHGGRNGELKATLRVNKVTITGDGLHPGRTIIGQIHASKDEPARLYYRKLPNAEYGCIYLEHEIREGDDVTFNLIGDEKCEGNGPSNGIKLDELFSYEIINDGAEITINIRRGDENEPIIATTTVDMNSEDSGYDVEDEWMYYKAGLYTQNNTGDDDDTDVATFYRLSNSHD